MVLLLTQACSSSAAGTQPSDAWLRYRTPTVAASPSWIELDRAAVCELREDRVSEAMKLLADVSARKVSKETAATMAGQCAANLATTSAFLVRAVRNLPSGGRYIVLTDGKNLTVQHGSLAKKVSLKRSALLVGLSADPGEVFVEVIIAE